MRTRFNVALVLALLLTVAPITAAADRVMTLYPIALLNGTIAGEYEWETGTDTTRVVHFSAAGVASSDEKAFAIAGGYGIHKYLDGQALNGLYLGGTISAIAASAADSGTSDSAYSLIVGLDGRIGYKYQFSDAFVADVAVNAAVPIFATASVEGNSASAFGAGKMGVGLRIGVGYTW